MKEHKNWVLILLVLILLSSGILYLNPSITGEVVYDYQESTKTWNLNNLNYNSEEIEFSNNLKLKLQIEDNSYTEMIENTATIISATKNGDDKTNKVTEIDNKKVTVNENKIFDINFNHELNNEDVINLRLQENDEVIVSLCNQENPAECYASLNYPGEEGDYILTIQDLENPASSFNLKVDDRIKINYISATYYTEEFHNITNSSYPESSSIQTEDLTISGLDVYGILTKEEILNEQTIDYFYSTDSGNSWNQIDNFNLSSVIENPIRFKIILNSDTITTPTLNSLSQNYFTKSCTENWACTDWDPEECPSTEAQTRICTDSNECGTENDKPEEAQTCEYSCEERWECTPWGSCTSESAQSRLCTDTNNCTGNKIEIQNCTYINYSTKYEIRNSEIVNILQDTVTEILTDKTKLEILVDDNVTNKNISIIDYNSSDKALPGKVSAKRFVDINVDDEIEDTLKNYILKVYYTDEDIQGLDENSLKIHYYNENIEGWEILESYVNNTENYVWANLTHFSTYGIFGDEVSQPSTQSYGGSSGGSSSSRIKDAVITPQIKELEESQIEEKKEEIMEQKKPVPQEQEEKTFKNFITGQTTLIKDKLAEFAKKNIYPLLIILGLMFVYIIFRSISFFKVKDEKKLIIFDFDGVLADTFDKTYEGFNYLAEKYNFKPLKSKDELRDLYKQNIFKSLKKINIKPSDILKIKRDASEIANKEVGNVKTFSGIKNLIKNLKKYNLAIISSNERDVIKKFLKKNEIDYFNLILDYKIQNKKRKLRKAIKHFKLRTKEALFITDTVGDVKEAKKLKIEIIAVTWGYHKKEDFKGLNVKIVDNPTDILRNI